jgi:hypothetical protein
MAKYNPPHYGRFRWMQSVCTSTTHAQYKNFGAVGIKCYWNRTQYKDFYQWLMNTLGPQPTLKHQLSRLDKRKDFEPGNLAWHTATERSRCHTLQNVFAKYRNQGKSLAQWSEDLNIPYYTLRRRVSQGMSIKDIIKEFQ